LCSNATRQSEAVADTPDSQTNAAIEHLSKPCGPYKLARALERALRRLQLLRPKEPSGAHQDLTSLQLSDPNDSVQAPHLGSKLPPSVQANETALAESIVSQHTQMPTQMQRPNHRRSSSSPEIPSRSALYLPPNAGSPLSSDLTGLTEEMKQEALEPILQGSEKNTLRILLVDDNAINLRLLQVFMRKLGYDAVHSAKDGSIAVNTVKGSEYPYDVIFMGKRMTQCFRCK
jgi:hypothetical protein